MKLVALPVVLWVVSSTTGCIYSSSRRQNEGPPPPREVGPLELRLALDPSGRGIRFEQVSGNLCDGALTGEIRIRDPGGAEARHSFHLVLYEERCVGCDPYPGAPPNVCDNACTREPAELVVPFEERMGGGPPFTAAGEHVIAADATMSCTPTRVTVQAVTVTVDESLRPVPRN